LAVILIETTLVNCRLVADEAIAESRKREQASEVKAVELASEKRIQWRQISWAAEKALAAEIRLDVLGEARKLWPT
jgi:hypothetical protein